MRCARFSTRCSASSSAATLSGLFPERAKCTISVGVRGASELSGQETMSVLAIAAARRAPPLVSAGARHSPTKEEVPAPVSTTRSSGFASSGSRKLPNCASATTRSSTSGHTCGCCVISRAVQYAPNAPPARYYSTRDFRHVEKIDGHMHVHGPADRLMAQAVAAGRRQRSIIANRTASEAGVPNERRSAKPQHT
jgi:hypothetical protein